MEDDTFWTIIGRFKLGDELGEEEQLEPIVQELAKRAAKDMKQFEEALSYKLYLLDTKMHAENIGEDSYSEDSGNYFSPDLFLYIRCYAVSRGREFFELVLNNPQFMPKAKTFEPLLTVTSRAYEKRRGKDFEYIPGYDYETFSNIEGWM
jgi:hypothetical protein